MSWQGKMEGKPLSDTGYTSLQETEISHDTKSDISSAQTDINSTEETLPYRKMNGDFVIRFTGNNELKSIDEDIPYCNKSFHWGEDGDERRFAEESDHNVNNATRKGLREKSQSHGMSSYMTSSGIGPTFYHNTGQGGHLSEQAIGGFDSHQQPVNENKGYTGKSQGLTNENADCTKHVYQGHCVPTSDYPEEDYLTSSNTETTFNGEVLQDGYSSVKHHTGLSQGSGYTKPLQSGDSYRKLQLGDGEYIHPDNDIKIYEDCSQGGKQDGYHEIAYKDIDPDYPGSMGYILQPLRKPAHLTLGGATVTSMDDHVSEDYLTLPESAIRPLPKPPRSTTRCSRPCQWKAVGVVIIVVLLGAIIGGILISGHRDDTETTTAVPTPGLSGWTEWTDWSSCDKTCDQGIHTRSRVCRSEKEVCIGPTEQAETCIDQLCPVPPRGVWSSWSQWSICSVTCGPGVQVRTRHCEESGDKDCVGDSGQQRDCNHGNCKNCNFSCPGGGVVITDVTCDQCKCNQSSTLQLTVTDTNNIPLDGVTISDKQWAGKQLAISNSNGQIKLDGVCSGTVLMFLRAGYVTQEITVSVTMDTRIRLAKIVLLYITAHPQNKLRLTGESVRLCCTAEGSPPPEYFEWYRDGIFVKDIWGDNYTSELSVSSLSQTNDAGGYTCKAHNRFSAVTSYPGTLVINNAISAFCQTSLQSKSITINNCVDNKPVQVDVGKCEPLPCRNTNSDNDDSSCGNKGGLCCGPKSTATDTVECGTVHVLVLVITKCGCIPCPTEGTNIQGKILDYSTRMPIASAIITAIGFEAGRTSSDFEGSFFMVLSDTQDSRHVQLTATHIHYTDLPRSISISQPGQAHIEIFQMIEKEKPIQIESSEDSTLPLLGSSPSARRKRAATGKTNQEQYSFNSNISIPGDSFLTLNGSEYDGSVNASITSIDTSDFNAMINAPAGMNYINNNGDFQPLRGYALFTLNFIDASVGERLQLRHNISITMELPYRLNGEAAMFMYNDQSATWDKNIQLNVSETDTSTTTAISGSFFVQQDISWLMIAAEVVLDDICFSKIKVYENNNYDNLVTYIPNIKIIVNDQPSGSVPNYGEISSFRAISDSGNVEGYCIAHSCQRTSSVRHYTGLLTAEGGVNPDVPYLTPAQHHEGITDQTAELINYDIDDITGIPLIRAKLKYNIIPKGNYGPYYDQHIYNWQRSDTCSKIPEDHFRFYLNNATSEDESCIKETEFSVQEDVLSATDPEHLNNLAWFSRSQRSLYDTCYVKVLVSSPEPVSIRVLSKVGNISHGEDIIAGETLYGFRDKCQLGAMCLEIKHPGKVADGQMDYTRIEVSHLRSPGSDIACSLADIKWEMTAAYGEYIPTLPADPEFHMYLKDSLFGPTFGVYCVKSEQNKQTARNKAKAMCYRGDYDDSLTLLEMENSINWAVKFDCQ